MKKPNLDKPVIDMKRYDEFKVMISQTSPMDVLWGDLPVTDYELLIMTIYRLNDLIVVTNEYTTKVTEVLNWILNEGLEQSVSEKLIEWLNDGTLENLINETLFNMKLDKSEFLEFLEEYNIFLTEQGFTNEEYRTSLSELMNDMLGKVDFEDYKNGQVLVNEDVNGKLESLEENKLDIIDFDDFKTSFNEFVIENDLKIKAIHKTINDFYIDITPYYDRYLDLSVAVEKCIEENYSGDVSDEGLSIYFPTKEYITHNSINVSRACLKLKGGSRTVIKFVHKNGVTNGVDKPILKVENHLSYNLRRIIIDGFELRKDETYLTYKVTGLELNKGSSGAKAVVDSHFNNLYIVGMDIGISAYASWCNEFTNIRVQGCKKPLYIVQQSNNFNFTRCSFVSFDENIDFINAEGISFIGCEFANYATDFYMCLLYQSSVTMINPYIENITSRKFTLLQNAPNKSAITVLGGQLTDDKTQFYFDGVMNNHVEVSGVNRGTVEILRLFGSSKSNDLRLNNNSFELV